MHKVQSTCKMCSVFLPIFQFFLIQLHNCLLELHVVYLVQLVENLDHM